MEIVISLALIAFGLPAVLQSLGALAAGQGVHSQRVGAAIAARSQIEAVKQAAYDTSVSVTPAPAYSSLPTQLTVGGIPYNLAITAQLIAPDVQVVTVAVADGDRVVSQIETYKVKR